jgi:hypothetical protein
MTQANDSTTKTPGKTHEEPEITQEESVPTDGRDVEGEKLMKGVVNEKLAEKPGEEKKKD